MQFLSANNFRVGLGRCCSGNASFSTVLPYDVILCFGVRTRDKSFSDAGLTSDAALVRVR